MRKNIEDMNTSSGATAIDRLSDLFTRFPGIGPRQARRFVYFLLSRPNGFIAELEQLIRELRSQAKQCQMCFRYFIPENVYTSSQYCDICENPQRMNGTLTIIAREADMEAIERSGTYSGSYFILGGTVPVLSEQPEKLVRMNELLTHVSSVVSNGLSEIVLALPANPDGDNTTDIISQQLEPLAREHGVRISKLGRGLSTGLELEYSDAETLKNAFQNRQ